MDRNILDSLLRAAEEAVFRKALASQSSQREIACRPGLSRVTPRKKRRESGLG